MNHESKNISIDLYGDGIGKVQLVQSMGSDKTVVQAARVSFGKDEAGDTLNEKDIKLIDYLIRHNHTSVLEHCSVTFKLVVPLFVRSQHHRHRTWSYNEWSNRYRDLTKEENSPRFYNPPTYRTQHKSNRQASNTEEQINPWVEEPDQWIAGSKVSDEVTEHFKYSIKLYDQMIALGVCREQARMVLPQSMYTEYFATCCASNLFKFIDLRTHEGAQWEIQKVAEAMLTFASELWPITTKAYQKIRNEKVHP